MTPVCSVRIYVGSGIPGGTYRGLATAIDSSAFDRFLEKRVLRSFPNATGHKAQGFWRGGREDSWVIEVFEQPTRRGCRDTVRRAQTLARDVARKLGQEAVMVIASDAEGRTAQSLVTAA